MPSKVETAHEDLGKCLALTERPKNPPIQKSVVKSNGHYAQPSAFQIGILQEFMILLCQLEKV